MRAIAREPLLRDKFIGGLPMPLRGGTPSGIVDVLDYIRAEGWHPGFDRDVWSEERDAGRTKDFVIPVTPKLRVMVNQTWGVRWGYETEDLFVNRQYPQLAEPEQHDASQRPSGVRFRHRYIPPDELGAITKECVVDAYQLAFDIGALVAVFHQDDSIVKIGLGRMSGGVFCPFSHDYSELTIFTNSDTAGALTLRLGLSHQNGSRYVAFTAENEEVYKVEGRIRAFYDFRPRPSLYAEPR